MKKVFPILISLLLIVPVFANAQTLQDAKKKIDMQQYDKAAKAIQSLLASDPTNIDLYFNLGKSYWLMKNYDSAAICYNKIETLNPNSPLSFIGKGTILIQQKNSKEAQINFDKAVKFTKAKDASTNLLIAEAYIYGVISSTEEALNWLAKAKEIKSSPELFMLMGDAYQLKFDGGGPAATNYEIATDQDPKYTSAWFKLAILNSRSKNVKDAETQLLKVKELDPAYIPVYKELGDIYYSTNRIKQFNEMYEKYLELSDNDPVALAKYAAGQYAAHQFQKCIDAIKKLPKNDPSFNWTISLLAYSYYELDNCIDGVVAMKRVFEIIPADKLDSTDYQYYYKLLLKCGGDTALAIKTMRKIMEMDPSQYELHRDIAKLYQKMGKTQLEIAEYDTLIKKSPKPNTQDLFMLAYELFYDGKYGKSDTLFKKFIELDTTYLPAYGFRVMISIYHGDSLVTTGEGKDACLQYLVKYEAEKDSALKKRQKNNTLLALKYLGTYYVKVKNDCPKGRPYFMQALKLDPEDAEVKEIVSGLTCN